MSVRQLDSESESSVLTMDIYEREGQMVIDYSSLGSELTAVRAAFKL